MILRGINKIKTGLGSLVLVAALSMGMGCGDEASQPIDAGVDAGDVEEEEDVFVDNSFEACGGIGAFRQWTTEGNNFNTMRAPLPYDIELSGGIIIRQGSRFMVQREPLIYFYTESNPTAQCIPRDICNPNDPLYERCMGNDTLTSDHDILTYERNETAYQLGQENPSAGLLLSTGEACACAPAAISCNPDTGEWEYVVEEVRPFLAEACDWIDHDCNGNPINIDDTENGFGPNVPYACIDEEALLGHDFVLFDGDVNPNTKVNCERGHNFCTEFDYETGEVSSSSGWYGLGALNEELDWEEDYCGGFTGPAATEICDAENIDHNCNGINDYEEDLGPCGNDRGECTLGEATCLGDDVICEDSYDGGPEVCDGRDNDCDGLVDEDLYRYCLDACGEGIQTCIPIPDGVGGFLEVENWGECSTAPEEEICDGVDNDCDGDTDPGCVCTNDDRTDCRLNATFDSPNQVVNWETGFVEPCGIGDRYCVDGVWEEECHFPIPTLTDSPDYVHDREEECNTYDENCDGVIGGDLNDDGVFIPLQRPCYSGGMDGRDPDTGEFLGECQPGNQLCDPRTGGYLLECVGQVLPAEEDNCYLGTDANCDGDFFRDLEHPLVDIMVNADGSGSASRIKTLIIYFLDTLGSRLDGDDILWALTVYGNEDASLCPDRFTGENRPAGCPYLVTDFVTYSEFRAALEAWPFGGSHEYDLDSLYQTTHPSLNDATWRENAYLYVILIGDGDDPPRTFDFAGDNTAAAAAIRENIRECAYAGCEEGEELQVVIYNNPRYFDSDWRNVTYNVWNIFDAIISGELQDANVWDDLACRPEEE